LGKVAEILLFRDEVEQKLSLRQHNLSLCRCIPMKITKIHFPILLLASALCLDAAAAGRGSSGRYKPVYRSGLSSWVAPLVVLGVAGAVVSAARRDQELRNLDAARAQYLADINAHNVYVPPIAREFDAAAYARPYDPLYAIQAPVVIHPMQSSPAVVPPAVPPDAVFFCRSVGQVFPKTNYCPEGWQRLSPFLEP
jgi:hypothetical protein